MMLESYTATIKDSKCEIIKNGWICVPFAANCPANDCLNRFQEEMCIEYIFDVSRKMMEEKNVRGKSNWYWK